MPYMVTLYKVSKKINSTAQPAGPGLQTICKLKDGSGILNPTIVLDFTQEQTWEPQNFNMAYIPEFSRYYWITDIRYIMGLWEFSLRVDVLASWKTQIGAQSMYVMRSASNYDTSLVDTFYPIKTGVTFTATTQASNPFATAFGSGYFVVGIINGDSTAVGAVAYYVFTSAEFRTFASYVLGNTAYWGITEVSDQLLKCLYNPFQYVVSCTWLPVAPPTSGTVNPVKVGWWDIPVGASRLSATVRTSGTVTITIPKHPGGTDRKFLLGEPFTTYYLDFPPFGAFSVPSAYLVDASYIDFSWSVDCITGQGKLQMGAENASTPFDIIQGQIGVQVQLAQMMPDIPGLINQVVPTTHIGWVDSLLNTAGNIASAVIATKLPMQTTGANGGFSAGYYPIRLTGTFAYLADENLSEFGRPCCKTLTINTLSGFVQCASEDFLIPATSDELSEIAGYLTSGFYYE